MKHTTTNTIKNKIMYILLAVSILFMVDVASAWSNGKGNGITTDPNNPIIGTHDLMLNSAISMLPADLQSKINATVADYGSEMPNYNNTICNCTYGIGDKGEHHVYYFVNGTVMSDDSAVRAKAEYDLAMISLKNGDQFNFSMHIGAMSHYISDPADYGHTMENGTDWNGESSVSNVDYQHYVNKNPDLFFNGTYIKFDGRYENTSAYDATLTIANDTTFDNNFGDGIYTNIWMNDMMSNNTSSPYAFADPNFTARTRQSINYSVNLLADVLSTMTLPVSIPTPVVVPSSGGSSGSSSGGTGGGSIGTAESYNNIYKYEIQERYLLTTPISFKYSTKDLTVYEVRVTGNESTYASLRVEVLRNTSSLVDSSAPGTVYKNFNAWMNYKRIKNAIIMFKVENSWLDSNGLSATDIKMYRWNNGNKEWIGLQTNVLNKDDKYTYFGSETDVISGSFAISGIKNEVAPVHIEPSTITTLESVQIEQTENKSTTSKKAPGFDMILSIVSIISMVHLFRKINV